MGIDRGGVLLEAVFVISMLFVLLFISIDFTLLFTAWSRLYFHTETVARGLALSTSACKMSSATLASALVSERERRAFNDLLSAHTTFKVDIDAAGRSLRLFTERDFGCVFCSPWSSSRKLRASVRVHIEEWRC